MLSLLNSRLPSDIVDTFFLKNETHLMSLEDCFEDYDYSILETHPDFDVSDVLQYAARDGNLKRVKWLASDKGADINADQGYALVVASEGGHEHVVEWLLENGCNPKPQSSWALRVACRDGHVECVKHLMKYNGVYTIACTTKTPLTIAAINGHYDIVKFIIESEYYIDMSTAFFNAGMYGNLDVCKYLYIASIDIPTLYFGIKRKILELARRCSHDQIIEWIETL